MQHGRDMSKNFNDSLPEFEQVSVALKVETALQGLPKTTGYL